MNPSTNTTGAVRSTVETGKRAGTTGVNTATAADRAAGDTAGPGTQ